MRAGCIKIAIREGFQIMNKWYENLTYIDDETLNTVPPIVSHEYRRIKELFDAQEVYGALFQLKDTVETIIKLYTTIAIAEIYAKEGKSNDEIRILASVTDKPLSLGDWAAFSETLVECTESDDLAIILDAISNWKNSPQILAISWRNRCIGHGALGYYETPEFEQDFKHMFDVVNDLFAKHSDVLSKFVLGTKAQGEFIAMTDASDIAGDLDSIICKAEGKELILYPFLVIRDKEYYFFDTFIPAKNPKTDLLNYYWGRKIIDKNSVLTRRIAELHETYKVSNAHNVFYSAAALNDSVENDAFLLEMQNALFDNAATNTEKCTDFESWLNERMASESKGIYLLKAHRGSGKTTCINQIENGQLSRTQRIGKTAISLAQTTTKVVYIDAHVNKNAKMILQDLEYKMISDRHYNIQLRGTGIVSIDKRANQASAELANYLNHMIPLMQSENLCNEKFLLIFDGVDELGDDMLSILRYIPALEDLNENIYILLTSRIESELTTVQQNELSKLNLPEANIYTLDAKDDVINRMTSYAKKELPTWQDDKINSLIEKADKNFAYLHFLVSAKKYDIDSEMENDLKGHIRSYLSLLEKYYGQKYISTYYQVLYILANGKISMSAKDISVLLQEPMISFNLLGALSDMQGIIKIDRKDSNYYSFEHELLQQAFVRVLEENKWYQAAKTLLLDGENGWTDFLTQFNDTNVGEANISSLRRIYLLIKNHYVPADELNRILTNEYLYKLYEHINDVSVRHLNNPDTELILNRLSSSVSEYIESNRDYLKAEYMIDSMSNEHIKKTFAMLGDSDMAEKILAENVRNDIENITQDKEKYTLSCLKLLFDARRDWASWFAEKMDRNDLDDMRKEISDLNDTYTSLSFCVSLGNEIGLDRKSVLVAICRVLSNLTECYRKMKDTRYEDRFIYKYLRYLSYPEMRNEYDLHASTQLIRMATILNNKEEKDSYIAGAAKIILGNLKDSPMHEIRGIELIEYFYNQSIFEKDFLNPEVGQEAYDSLMTACEQFKKALTHEEIKEPYYVLELRKSIQTITNMFKNFAEADQGDDDYRANMQMLRDDYNELISGIPYEVIGPDQDNINDLKRFFVQF